MYKSLVILTAQGISMSAIDFIETPANYEQKTICCLVVDVSASMSNLTSGGMPIDQLNKGIKQFHDEIHEDHATANRLEIAIVEFSDTIEIVQQPALVDQFSPPVLKTKGTTKLVDGVRTAIRLVQSRKQYYKNTGQPYNRPWIVLITDGAPDNDQDIKGLAAEIEIGMATKDFFFLPIGVTGADMAMLNSISGSDSNHKVSPLALESAKFSEFFKWLSQSMAIASNDEKESNLPIPSWITGYKK